MWASLCSPEGAEGRRSLEARAGYVGPWAALCGKVAWKSGGTKGATAGPLGASGRLILATFQWCPAALGSSSVL